MSSNQWPEDTDNEMYLSWEYTESTLEDLIERAQEKWPGISFSDLSVSVTHLKTDGCACCFNRNDYTAFIIVSKKVAV